MADPLPPPTSQIFPGEPLETLREFGPQPVSNRFPEQPGNGEYFQEMTLGLCRRSGLVQLARTFPPPELLPRVPWLTVFEPEDHLDAVAEKLASLPGLSRDHCLAGYSSKDDTTLKRLEHLGFRRQWRLDPAADLGVTDPMAFVETLQVPFVRGAAQRAVARAGRPMLFVVRHVLEHSYDLQGFLGAAAGVVDKGGYVMFEVPDCTRALDQLDYTTLWEEHSVYFTPATFRTALESAGLEPVVFDIHPHPFENCMVAVCRRTATPAAAVPVPQLQEECGRARRFGHEFPAVTTRLRKHLEAARRDGRKLALFGAGHLAIAFLNLHGLAEFFEFAVDDNPHKVGRHLPGCGLPIRASRHLAGDRIDICLLGLNPESEPKVIARNGAFQEAGGVFASIFPSSPCYFFR